MGRTRLRRPWRAGRVLALIFLVFAFITFFADWHLSISWESKPIVPKQLEAIYWVDDGDGELEANEIVTSSIDLNPYKLKPQKLYCPQAGTLIAIKATVKYRVEETVSQGFYGVFAVKATKPLIGADKVRWLFSDVAQYSYHGKDADGQTIGSITYKAKFVRAKHFTSAQAGGPYTSQVVFPYSYYTNTGTFAYILPFSKGLGTIKFTDGSPAGDQHSVEYWLEKEGFSSFKNKDIYIDIWFGYVRDSKTSGRLSEEDFIALPKRGPRITIQITDDPETGQQIQIVDLDWNYITQAVIPLHAFGGFSLITLNWAFVALIALCCIMVSWLALYFG